MIDDMVGPSWWMGETPPSQRTDPFTVIIRGYYTSGPDITDADVEVMWKSERNEKRLAELEVLRVAFEDWYASTKQELVNAAHS